MQDYPTLAAPSGRVGVTLAHHGQPTRFKTYGWNEHPDVVNPGDMLIVATPAAGVAVQLMIRGRDMAGFADAALACAALYEENADWLSAPVTTVRAAS